MRTRRGTGGAAPGVLLGSALLAGILPAPLPTEPAQQPPAVLRIGIVSTGNFLPLPPELMPDTPEAWVMRQVYGPGLITAPVDPDERPRLALATAINLRAVVPGRLYLDLRPNLQFQLGGPAGLPEYQNTYRVYRRIAREGELEIDPAFAHLDSIEVDAANQRIGLWMDPADLTASALRIAAVPPLPPRLVRMISGETGSRVIEILSSDQAQPGGLGPYLYDTSLSRWAEEPSGQPIPSVVLNASETYYEGKPDFDRVEIYIFHSDRRLIQALVTGEVDAARLPDWRSHQAAASQVTGSSLRFVLRKYPRRDHLYFVAFNTTYGPLRNAVLRRAISWAIDRRDLIAGPPASVLMNDIPVQPASTPAGVAGRRALGAKNLLQTEAGYRVRSGVLYDQRGRALEEFTLFYPNNTEHYEEIARRIRLDLADIGISVRPQPVDPGLLRERLHSGDYEMALSEMTIPSTPEATRYYFHSSNAASGINFTRYSSRTFDSNIDAYLNPPAGIRNRQQYLDGAYKTLRDDQALAILYYQIDEFWAFSTGVLDVNTVGRTETHLEPLARWKRSRR